MQKLKNPYLIWKDQYYNLKYPKSYFNSKKTISKSKNYANPKAKKS